MYPPPQGPVIPQHNGMGFQPQQGHVPSGHHDGMAFQPQPGHLPPGHQGAMGYPPQQPQNAPMPHGQWPPEGPINAPGYAPPQGPMPMMPERGGSSMGYGSQGREGWGSDGRPGSSATSWSMPREHHMPNEQYSEHSWGGGSGNPSPYQYPSDSWGRQQNDITNFIVDRPRWPSRRGGCADVSKCKMYWGGNNQRREKIAVKCLRIQLADLSEEQTERILHRIRKDVHTWMRLPRSDNVLPVYGMATGFGPLPSIVTPWMYNGTLTSYLERKPNLSYQKRMTMIMQVALGLNHLHTNNIYHGDLTGSNVLINHNGDTIVSDFGLASIMAEFNYTAYFRSCRPGALRWTDPDLVVTLARHDRRHAPALHGETEDPRYDVYSLGCIMLQIITGLVPYYPENDLAVQLAKFRYENPRISTRVSPKLAGLMEWCWDRNRRIRPKPGKLVASIRQEMGRPQVWHR